MQSNTRHNERQWKRMRQADPWRGKSAVSLGTVVEVGPGRISHEAQGLCICIAVEAEGNQRMPPVYVFWYPDSMRKGRKLPEVGARIRFWHQARLGIRAFNGFDLPPPPPPQRTYDTALDVYYRTNP